MQYAYRLDGGGGRGPDSIIPYSVSKQEQATDYGRGGYTAKVRYSKTELKYGEHRPTLPVDYTDDSRQLVTTYHGTLIESKEVDKLTLTAGDSPKSAAGNPPTAKRCTCSMGLTLSVAAMA